MEMHKTDRPLAAGDVIKLRSRESTGNWRTREQVWVIDRIQPMVFCLGGGPGIRMTRPDDSMWIAFPFDRRFEIIERLHN
jgi:hypothetical protein